MKRVNKKQVEKILIRELERGYNSQCFYLVKQGEKQAGQLGFVNGEMVSLTLKTFKRGKLDMEIASFEKRTGKKAEVLAYITY